MISAQKDVILVLVLILAISNVSLLIIKPVSAESIPAPAIPQFTLRYDKASFNSTDPYTGVSQQVDNSTIDIIVNNQPFNNIYNAMDNITTSLYYNVQVKGHHTESWTEAFNSINYSYPLSDKIYTWYGYPVQSNSESTIVSLPANYPVGSQVDFRVQAVIANQTEIIIPNFIPNPIRGGDYTHETVMFIVQTSDWSGTQTITIGDNSSITPTTWPSPSSATSYPSGSSSNPTATPIQPNTGNSVFFGLGWGEVVIIALLSAVAVLLVFVVVYLRKRSVK